MITVVAKKDFFIRATGLLPNIIYCELPKLIYAYNSCSQTKPATDKSAGFFVFNRRLLAAN